LPELPALRQLLLSGRRAEAVLELAALHRRALPDVARRQAPDAAEFYRDYFATLTPVVLTDLVRAWPAFSKWTPEYLSERFGHVEVEMTDGREADPEYDQRTREHSRSILLRDFVARLRRSGASNDFYLVARGRNTLRPELLPLFEDVALPDGWFELERLPAASALWFGPAGTVTPLHHDTSSILFCQVYGRKRVTLVAPFELAMYGHARSLYSELDPERGDALPHAARALEVTLEPGEALFIPVGYWHHVRALDVSISLALNGFCRPNSFEWFRPGELR
jgi:hypothetical protein